MDIIQGKLEHYMERWTCADRFSGTVLVAQGEQILLSKGYGYANYEYHIANGPSTLYPIASITKLFTADRYSPLQPGCDAHWPNRARDQGYSVPPRAASHGQA